eukprot:Mycagemm_TRINITY_DN10280_c0_g17::TRINITY_DN10280_c0_g17_i1::g.3786::m.3786 type:complete len:125 gc:universal TRINITY_DN10280_c0_g17_i1:1183-809(-)
MRVTPRATRRSRWPPLRARMALYNSFSILERTPTSRISPAILLFTWRRSRSTVPWSTSCSRTARSPTALRSTAPPRSTVPSCLAQQTSSSSSSHAARSSTHRTRRVTLLSTTLCARLAAPLRST